MSSPGQLRFAPAFNSVWFSLIASLASVLLCRPCEAQTLGTITYQQKTSTGTVRSSSTVAAFLRLRCVGARTSNGYGGQTWITDTATLANLIPDFYIVNVPGATQVNQETVNYPSGATPLSGQTWDAVAYDTEDNTLALRMRLKYHYRFPSSAWSPPRPEANGWYLGLQSPENGVSTDFLETFDHLWSRLGWWSPNGWYSGSSANRLSYPFAWWTTATLMEGSAPVFVISANIGASVGDLEGTEILHFRIDPDFVPPNFSAAFDETEIVDKLDQIRTLINPGTSSPDDLTAFEFPLESEFVVPDYQDTLNSVKMAADNANPLSKLSSDWGSSYPSTVTFSLSGILTPLGLTDTSLSNTISVPLAQFESARTIIHAFIVIGSMMWAASFVFEEFRRY